MFADRNDCVASPDHRTTVLREFAYEQDRLPNRLPVETVDAKRPRPPHSVTGAASDLTGGEGGIRTLETGVTRLTVFETAAFNRGLRVA